MRDALRSDVDLGRGGVGLRDAAAKGLHTIIAPLNNNNNSSSNNNKKSSNQNKNAIVVSYDWEPTPNWVISAIQEKESGMIRERQ